MLAVNNSCNGNFTCTDTVGFMTLQFTPSQENYLEHIWRLSSNESVRAMNLAESAGVKRPIEKRTVNTLDYVGLVKHKQAIRRQ
jgi:Mn-dependent DtxR family transcriptional regulator